MCDRKVKVAVLVALSRETGLSPRGVVLDRLLREAAVILVKRWDLQDPYCDYEAMVVASAWAGHREALMGLLDDKVWRDWALKVQQEELLYV